LGRERFVRPGEWHKPEDPGIELAPA